MRDATARVPHHRFKWGVKTEHVAAAARPSSIDVRC